jgi:prolipoprotein diacylglyceryltransferase
MHLREPVYPTPIYEVFLGLLIGGILWSLRKRIKIPGVIFFLYLIFNGLERFFIEKIRVNIRNPFLGFEVTQAEVIALLLVLTGIVGIAYLWWKNKTSSATQPL